MVMAYLRRIRGSVEVPQVPSSLGSCVVGRTIQRLSVEVLPPFHLRCKMAIMQIVLGYVGDHHVVHNSSIVGCHCLTKRIL